MHKLLTGHATFKREFVEGSRTFLDELAAAHQSPDALYVGCADSRVVPELLTSSAPGDLFVVRNVANLVPRAEKHDNSVGAALEYAIEVLGIRHVVVCGHYGCGGVKAMIHQVDAAKFPELFAWLADAAVSNAAANRLDVLDEEEHWELAVEENVLDQLVNLSTYPSVKERLVRGEMHLHGWVYDLRGDLYVYDVSSATFVHN